MNPIFPNTTCCQTCYTKHSVPAVFQASHSTCPAGWLQAAGCSLSLLLMSSNGRTLTLTVSTVTAAAAAASHLVLFSHYRFCTASLLITHPYRDWQSKNMSSYSCFSRAITHTHILHNGQGTSLKYCAKAQIWGTCAYLSISILFYFLALLHYISGGNIVLYLSHSCSHFAV